MLDLLVLDGKSIKDRSQRDALQKINIQVRSHLSHSELTSLKYSCHKFFDLLRNTQIFEDKPGNADLPPQHQSSTARYTSKCKGTTDEMRTLPKIVSNLFTLEKLATYNKNRMYACGECVFIKDRRGFAHSQIWHSSHRGSSTAHERVCIACSGPRLETLAKNREKAGKKFRKQRRREKAGIAEAKPATKIIRKRKKAKKILWSRKKAKTVKVEVKEEPAEELCVEPAQESLEVEPTESEPETDSTGDSIRLENYLATVSPAELSAQPDLTKPPHYARLNPAADMRIDRVRLGDSKSDVMSRWTRDAEGSLVCRDCTEPDRVRPCYPCRKLWAELKAFGGLKKVIGEKVYNKLVGKGENYSVDDDSEYDADSEYDVRIKEE